MARAPTHRQYRVERGRAAAEGIARPFSITTSSLARYASNCWTTSANFVFGGTKSTTRVMSSIESSAEKSNVKLDKWHLLPLIFGLQFFFNVVPAIRSPWLWMQHRAV
ncbi:hypothetical protein [Sinorhizobium sp. BJ1]|uniref:hypothetical protein n=1 Tax=Sinorhizobium sp. BJ1 TaxID=2035455 RepID=UPI0011858ED9|nr:hypothetical protein [Sinorhizobium sp. BJ1]